MQMTGLSHTNVGLCVPYKWLSSPIQMSVCVHIAFAGMLMAGTPLENPLWVDGLRMFTDYTNR